MDRLALTLVITFALLLAGCGESEPVASPDESSSGPAFSSPTPSSDPPPTATPSPSDTEPTASQEDVDFSQIVSSGIRSLGDLVEQRSKCPQGQGLTCFERISPQIRTEANRLLTATRQVAGGVNLPCLKDAREPWLAYLEGVVESVDRFEQGDLDASLAIQKKANRELDPIGVAFESCPQ